MGVIVGSVRTDRLGLAPATWIAEQARGRDGLDVDLIDLADHEVPSVLRGGGDTPTPASVTALGHRLKSADAFVVVTPVYNRSFPGSIKNAIDWFYAEWQLKLIGFVSYGGTFGGLEAVAGLRGVFEEFDTVTLSDPITFANAWDAFDEDAQPVDAESCARRSHRLLDQLTWWATILREGRAQWQYPLDSPS